MKLAILLTMILVLISGCSTVQDVNNPKPMPTEISELVLNTQDLSQIGLIGGGDPQDLGILELNDSNAYCRTEKYNTSEFSPLEQYSLCSYAVTSLENTYIIVELKKFTNLNDLNGSYMYGSSHLRSVKGILSQDDFGDQSKFYLNNEEDYGGEFTNKSISYYALYFTKDYYLIYVSSEGSKDAKDYVANTGRTILSKFE